MKKNLITIVLFIVSLLLLYFIYIKLKPLANSVPSQSIDSIQAEANKIIAQYNKYEQEPPRKVIMPQMKEPLPQCSVPLQANWPKKPEEDPSPYWDIEVRCMQTVKEAKVKKWLIVMPTNRRKSLVDQTTVLREIKDEAAKLMNIYNQEHNTDWHSGEPNAKIVVPRCAVPLQSHWQYIISPIPPIWKIEVICTKTVPDDVLNEWNVLVSTTRPRHGKYE